MELTLDTRNLNIDKVLIKSMIYAHDNKNKTTLNHTIIDSMFEKKINNDCYFIVLNNRIDIYRLILDNYSEDELVQIKYALEKINNISYTRLRNIFIKQNISHMFPFSDKSCEMKIIERNLFKFLGNKISDIPINSQKN